MYDRKSPFQPCTVVLSQQTRCLVSTALIWSHSDAFHQAYPKMWLATQLLQFRQGIVKAWSCFSIFSSSKNCCPKLKKVEDEERLLHPCWKKRWWWVTRAQTSKIYVGQFFRDKQFPYLKCPKTGVHVACFGIGNDWIGLSVNGGETIFLLFFFTGELGAVFFWGVTMPFPCHQMQS